MENKYLLILLANFMISGNIISQNVGISTSTPSSKLHVVGISGDENSSGTLRLDGATGQNLRMGVLTGTRSWIQSHSNLPLYVNRIGNNTIFNALDGANTNVGIGTTSPTAKLEVDFNSNNDFAALKASGQYGPSNGYLGIQGKNDFDGVTTADWSGQEIGIAGISTGSSSTDNYGVKGHSNGVGIRGEHSTSGNFAELGTTTRSINANGDAYISNGWLSIGGTTSSTRHYGVQEITWNGNSQAADGTIYQTLGTFVIPQGIPTGTAIRIDKILWSVDGYHEDGNENHQIHVRFSTMGSAWYGWNGNTVDGAIDVEWQYINDFGTAGPTFTANQTIQMRVIDENCCWSDYFRVFNMQVKVYYSYVKSLQEGDIAASGRIYANSTTDVGDLAEYFEVDKEADAGYGKIVVLKVGSNNEYALSKEPYCQNIVGVVSKNPSVVLNNPEVGPAVALAGRVKVKVIRTNNLIKSGEFLTTSSQEGLAMRATQPGPVIGYAVENQVDGNDYVEILVQPGRFYYPRESAHEIYVSPELKPEPKRPIKRHMD
ncbi:MAG: hypothetical protein MK207_00535 [Saprospiraceae bacterium]|nr:hypothetical protein [Saprospiraceae bacterium]